MGWLETVQGDYPRVVVTAEGFSKERFGGGDVARSAEIRFDRFALFVDGAVEVYPPAAHLEVSLIHPPGIALPERLRSLQCRDGHLSYS
jgi:hypothetical protein